MRRFRPAGHDRSTAVSSIDYRLVAFGALLPDLIDKALTRYLFEDTFNDDHIFAHTLLFALSLLLPALYLARRGDARLLAIALGAFTHLLVDPVVREPRILFWPLLGVEFPHIIGLPSMYLRVVDAAIIVALLVITSLQPKGRLQRLLWRGRLY